jgi:outer membrane receptor protein involved in Fe transport
MRVAKVGLLAGAMVLAGVAQGGEGGAADAQTGTAGAAEAVSVAKDGAAGPSDQEKIEDIVVTATRRSESLDRVPISIQALSQEDLTQGAIKTIGDIASVTPGMTFQLQGYASTLTVISIRGLESLFGASTVGVYLDDTPIQGRLSSDGNVGNPYPALFDLKRVEVERGPQGTLFGSGSEAGTVRFISNEPSLTTFSGMSHVELGSTQGGGLSYEAGAAVGGPIVDEKIGYRISVWDRTNGGYLDRAQAWTGATVDRDTNTDKTFSSRVALGIQAGENIYITPSVYFQNIHGNDNGRFDLNFSNPSAGLFTSVTLLPETWQDRMEVPSVKTEVELPFAQLTGIVSYTHRKADLNNDLSGLLGAIGLVSYGNPLSTTYASSQADVSPLFTGVDVNAFTEEVRLASKNPNAFFTWVAGIFNDHRTQQDYQLQYSQLLDPTGKEIFYTLQTVKDDQTAIFAQGDLHLSKRWTATVGERIARVRTDQVNVNGTGALDAIPPYADNRLAQTPSTPHAALNFQADENNLFYVSSGKGFRVGGANDPLPPVCGYSAVPNTYAADFITNYEVGAKDLLFGGRMKIDSSVFHIKWDNIQQLGQPACGISYTFNAGSAVSNGFDMAMQGIVTERLKVDLNVGFANAHLTQDVFDAHGVILAQSGDKIGYLPYVNSPWNVNAAGNYQIPLPNSQRLSLRLEYKFRSHNPGPFINQIKQSPNYAPQLVSDPANTMWNFKSTLAMSKSTDLGFYVQNLFNAHPLLDKYGQATTEVPTYSTFRPRTIGVTANVTF